MNIAARVVILIPILLCVQSCSSFRTHLDETCVAKFKDQYSNPQDSPFSLPWQVGQSYIMTQGNCTLESHSVTQNQAMSFDFKMPMGSPVHAIADGRIAGVIEHYEDHKDNAYHQANLIGIEHAGGFVSWYMHLRKDGAVVEVNDTVKQGDLIAYSGNTGNSAYPHLHLYVQQITRECFDEKNKTADLTRCPMKPISFNNASPADTVLQEFQVYKAQAIIAVKP